jgi:hypothetical protein
MKMLIVGAAILLCGLLPVSKVISAEHAGTATATFAVYCFDVGASALQGKKGVVSVGKGWLGSSEINTVVYFPDKVSVKRMEDWLRDSGTYRRTIANDELSGEKGGRK